MAMLLLKFLHLLGAMGFAGGVAAQIAMALALGLAIAAAAFAVWRPRLGRRPT